MKSAAIFLTFFSVVVFALGVGQDIELTQYMNARYTARFTSQDKNIAGSMEKGDKGKIHEIKKFNSGNSGYLLEVTQGKLKGQKVWVYYNEKKPALKLLDSVGTTVTEPDKADQAQALRRVPVVREPTSGPGVTVSPDQLVVRTVDDFNRRQAGSDCDSCGAKILPDKITTSISAAGDINAKIKCSHRSDQGITRAGNIQLEIENNKVKYLDARINGCNVKLGAFKQLDMGSKDIVLAGPGDCRVVVMQNLRVRTGSPVLHFSMTPTQDCVRFCKAVENKFWQVEMNPNTLSCY